MRRKRAAVPVACAALLLAGCHVQPAPTPPAPTAAPTAAQASPPPQAAAPVFALPYCAQEGIHPITGRNRVNLALAPLLYKGLFSLDASFTPCQDLCASYTVSRDGLRWTFQLSPAEFSDGSPVTGAEAAASLNLARKSERFSARLADIRSVQAGKDSVTVTLTRANGNLPAVLDVPIVKETGDALHPLGCGAYILSEEGDAASLRLADNGAAQAIRAGGAARALETITLRKVEAGDDLVYAFDAGDISLVDVDLTGVNVPSYSARSESASYPTSTLLYVGCAAGKGPCRETAVRRAAGLSFDRQGLVRSALLGNAEASALPLHPRAAGYDAALAAGLDNAPAGAAALLDEAGWTLGEDGVRRKGREELALRLLVNQENAYKVEAAQILAAALENMGAAVTLEKLSWDDFVSALEKGDFDLYLGETAMTADFDPEVLIGSRGALNYGKYSDRQTEELLNAWRAAGEDTRPAAGQAFFTRLAQEAPILPLCFKNGSVLTQWGSLHHISPVQRNIFYHMETWTMDAHGTG